MTLCDDCRQPMKIDTAVVDLGEGREVIEVEACVKCRVAYISFGNYTTKPAEPFP